MFSKAKLIVAVAAFVLVSTFATSDACVSSDPDLKVCKTRDPNYNDCLKKYIQANIRNLTTKGGHVGVFLFNDLHSYEFKPLLTILTHLDLVSDSGNFRSLKLYRVYGFDEAVVTAITSNIDSGIFTANFSINSLRFAGFYYTIRDTSKDNINANNEEWGNCVINLEHPTLEVTLQGKPTKKDEKNYMHVNSVKITFKEVDDERTKIELSKNNKEITDKVFRILNSQKWHLVEKILPATASALQDKLLQIANKNFAQSPYEEFFPA